MTVDYRKLIQVMTPLAVAVVILPEQINTSSGTWCATIDPENAFFLVPVHKEHQ